MSKKESNLDTNKPITIKKLKDSWDREEVRKLLNESYLIGMYNANEDEEPIDHDEWMDKNL